MKPMQFSLRELRARKNETQEDISNVLGVSLPTYRDWEKKPEKITLGNARILARHFNIQVNEMKI